MFTTTVTFQLPLADTCIFLASIWLDIDILPCAISSREFLTASIMLLKPFFEILGKSDVSSFVRSFWITYTQNIATYYPKTGAGPHALTNKKFQLFPLPADTGKATNSRKYRAAVPFGKRHKIQLN